MVQIDMPMPKNCLDCPACNEYLMCAIPVNGRKWGENDVREFGQSRPEWCPMKEQEAENGEWITIWQEDDPDTSIHARCSICNRISKRPVGEYCKWCGTKMNQE